MYSIFQFALKIVFKVKIIFENSIGKTLMKLLSSSNRNTLNVYGCDDNYTASGYVRCITPSKIFNQFGSIILTNIRFEISISFQFLSQIKSEHVNRDDSHKYIMLYNYYRRGLR